MNSNHPIRQTTDRLMWCGFTDRNSYIAWRTEWRKTYLELSQLIRRLRVAAAVASQLRSKATTDMDTAATLPAFQEELLKSAGLRYFSGYDSWKHWASVQAKTLMVIRASSKQKAAQQYLSAKSLQATEPQSQPHSIALTLGGSAPVAV